MNQRASSLHITATDLAGYDCPGGSAQKGNYVFYRHARDYDTTSPRFMIFTSKMQSNSKFERGLRIWKSIWARLSEFRCMNFHTCVRYCRFAASWIDMIRVMSRLHATC